MLQSSLFLAQLEERPDLNSIWLLPLLFLACGGGVWFYAYNQRKSGADRWWRWLIEYGFMALALWSAGANLWAFTSDAFTRAAVGTAKKLQVSYYLAFALPLLALIGFVFGQFKGKKTDTEGLTY
jgi:hypothetical protein